MFDPILQNLTPATLREGMVADILSDRTSKIISEYESAMREHRRKMISEYPYHSIKRIHVENAKLLPTRYDMLDEMPKNAIVCEIGVAEGDFSEQILRRCTPQKLHLVDAWESSRYSAGYNRVLERFSDQLACGVVRIHQAYSTQALAEFVDKYFDWIYLDSVHDYRTTAEELSLCSQKIKSCGIIAGHDYTPGNVISPVCYGVIHAVHEFCVTRNWQFIYLTNEIHGYWSFALQKF